MCSAKTFVGELFTGASKHLGLSFLPALLVSDDETQQRVLPPPPSGPPPPSQETATELEGPIGQERRRQVAARIGVGALRIPLSNVNVPR